MSKGWLVAKREFDENVRTKTFWISILAVPVIMIVAIVVSIFLAKAKDARKYAVIDESGWLLAAIEERSVREGMKDVVVGLRELAEEEPEKLAELSPIAQELAARVTAPDVRLTAAKRVADRIADVRMTLFPIGAAGQGMYVPPVPKPSPDHDADVAVAQWWIDLTSEEARKIDPQLSRSDYQRIAVPEGEDPEEDLRALLQEGPKSLFAYFVFGPDPLGDGGRDFKYVSNNTIDDDLFDWIAQHGNDEVRQRRFNEHDISQDIADDILSTLKFEELLIDDSGEEADVGAEEKIEQRIPIFFVYMLWISVFSIVQILLTNTVEEKSNRIIEVLLSSVSPLQLMMGKVFGIAMTGLTMIISWITFFIIAIKVAPTFVDVNLPDFSFLLSNPIYLVSFVVYFLFGYLFYAAILVGIGSVCNSLKEAQNLMQPVVIVLILPLLAMVPIGEDPNGKLAFVLSYIPVFTPFVMMNRAAGPPELWEYIATTIIMVLSTWAAFWGAAKIFRIGILMTGKPPKMRDMLRWIRQPVGTVPEVEE